MTNGILLIDKPVGTRSSDCVNGARRALGGKIKVGHAGTLDSTASGLLVLLIGGATRLSDAVMMLPKAYRAVLRLGQATDTCDAAGQVIFEGDCGGVDDKALDRALFAFLGWRMQLPPSISAVKVHGLPAHKLARAGRDVPLKPRPVYIESLTRTSTVAEGRVEIEVRCGKGTYVRGLARDLGEALGCGAYVESLRRLSIGPFRVEDALPPLEAERLAAAGELPLRPMREAAAAFHRVVLDPGAEARISRGFSAPIAGSGRCAPGMMVPSDGVCVEGKKLFGFADRWRAARDLLLRPRVNVPMEA